MLEKWRTISLTDGERSLALGGAKLVGGAAPVDALVVGVDLGDGERRGAGGAAGGQR